LAHIEYKYTHYDEWINFYLVEKKQSKRIEGEPVYDSRKWRFKKHQGQRRFFTEVANKLTEFDIIAYGDLACAASHPKYRAKVVKGPIRRLYQFLVRDPRLTAKIIPIDESYASKVCNVCKQQSKWMYYYYLNKLF